MCEKFCERMEQKPFFKSNKKLARLVACQIKVPCAHNKFINSQYSHAIDRGFIYFLNSHFIFAIFV